jgi:sialate O-acetylesterase
MRICYSKQAFRVAVLLCGAALGSWAEVSLPSVIAEHMVLQRGLPVHIWGNADPSESVAVEFRGATRTAQADKIGRWSVYLPSGEAGGPFTLTVRGQNTLSFSDVLVGDVWVASGQSNMEFKLHQVANAQIELAAANHPRIRLFQVERNVSPYPVSDLKAKAWAECTPETSENFSAVAYFFGRDLEEKLHVPIGLIDTTWGGTPAEAWTSLDGLGRDASLMPVFSQWGHMSDDVERHMLEREQARKEAEKAAAPGTEPKPLPWAPNERLSWMPAGLYNAMIAPLTSFPIRGAIWYQGESNAAPGRAPLYAQLFKTLITDWRRNWAEGDFPFFFVQIANYKASASEDWPEVRDAQRQALSLVNTGMAVTIDIGNPDNIHPTNKQDVGLRLALAARAVAYGEKIEYSGPLFRQATPLNNSLQVWFDHVGKGLVAKGGELRGFEIAGPDAKFVPAEARIEGSSVVVSSTSVGNPVYVRYGWSNNPDCNLFNADGLPASPFRSLK